MNISDWINIFDQSIEAYHIEDHVDTPIVNPYSEDTLDHLMYAKNWIDTVQWHFEDIIRNPNIDPVEALALKRRIDASNQVRTDMVEFIDSWFLNNFKDVKVKDTAVIRTESPAWAIDKLSILSLKIYHMREETERTNADEKHLEACRTKLNILLDQQTDLSTAIQTLIDEIASGDVYMKVYKQMKMYNDPSLNPVLYANDKK